MCVGVCVCLCGTFVLGSVCLCVCAGVSGCLDNVSLWEDYIHDPATKNDVSCRFERLDNLFFSIKHQSLFS